MKELAYLEALSAEDFEIERLRIIEAAISTAPKQYQNSLRLQQKMIDDTEPSQRMKTIVMLMSEAIENLSDQAVALKNIKK